MIFVKNSWKTKYESQNSMLEEKRLIPQIQFKTFYTIFTF